MVGSTVYGRRVLCRPSVITRQVDIVASMVEANRAAYGNTWPEATFEVLAPTLFILEVLFLAPRSQPGWTVVGTAEVWMVEGGVMVGPL